MELTRYTKPIRLVYSNQKQSNPVHRISNCLFKKSEEKQKYNPNLQSNEKHPPLVKPYPTINVQKKQFLKVDFDKDYQYIRQSLNLKNKLTYQEVNSNHKHQTEYNKGYNKNKQNIICNQFQPIDLGSNKHGYSNQGRTNQGCMPSIKRKSLKNNISGLLDSISFKIQRQQDCFCCGSAQPQYKQNMRQNIVIDMNDSKLIQQNFNKKILHANPNHQPQTYVQTILAKQREQDQRQQAYKADSFRKSNLNNQRLQNILGNIDVGIKQYGKVRSRRQRNRIFKYSKQQQIGLEQKVNSPKSICRTPIQRHQNTQYSKVFNNSFQKKSQQASVCAGSKMIKDMTKEQLQSLVMRMIQKNQRGGIQNKSTIVQPSETNASIVPITQREITNPKSKKQPFNPFKQIQKGKIRQSSSRQKTLQKQKFKNKIISLY